MAGPTGPVPPALLCCVWETGPFSCDVKPSMIEQHFLIKNTVKPKRQ